MQDIENPSTNLEVRVYPPGVKRSGEKISTVQQAWDDTADIIGDNHAASPTPHKIDLPFQDLQTNATQTLGQNSIVLPLPSLERKSKSYDACGFQSKASSALLIHDGYSEMKNVLSDMKILLQDSQPKVCRDELQGTDGCPGGPTRVIYALQNTVGLEHKGTPHVETHTNRSTTSMKKKIRNSGGKKSPNTKKLNRPQHQIIKFLEDYTEFGADLKEVFEGRGKHCPTVLESTVDGSIVKGARRSYGPRSSSTIDAATQSISSHQDSLISLDKCGLKTEQHKYKCSMCEVTSRNRQDVEEHITAVGNLHSKAVVLVLLGSQARGQNCPICNIRFTRLQLFQHIRTAHRDCFPLRCGYCVFFGQDYYQLRHHIRKKHGTSRYNIIDMSRLLAGEEVTEDEPERKSLVCPLCRKSLKTLSNLKKHITQHSRKKQQCGHCSFVTTFPTQIRSHYRRMHPSQIPQWQTILLDKGNSNFLVEDVTPYMKLITEKYGILKPKEKGKWMRQYRCPHCEYTCSFNSSYNRHLRLHSGAKPYKCGYCDFHAREAYVIKKHCSTAHKGRDAVIENDKNFKAPYRYGAFSRDEEVESSRYLQKEKEVVYVKTHKKSTPPEPQKVKFNSTSAPQSDNKSQIIKTCGIWKSWTDKSVSEHETCSQNKDLRDKQNKTHSDVAVLKPQLCSSLNKSPSNKDISLNEENLVPDELQSNSMNGILVTSSVEHLHLQSATQDLSLKESHELGMVKQNITYCNSVEDEQSLRNISSVDNKSASLVHSPVKVRTVKKHNPPNKIDTIGYVPDRQCRNAPHSVESDVQRGGTSCVSMQPSAVIRLEERLSSTACRDPLTDMEEKTVLIYLQESRSGDLFIDKVKKIIHKSNPNREIHSSSNNEDLSNKAPGPQRMKKSCTVHSEIVRPDENTRHDKCNWSHAHTSTLMQADDSIEHNSFKGVPNRRVEINLHNPINCLPNLEAQCCSNYNVPTSGILKCDQQDGSYTNNDYFSSDKVRMMMQKEDGRVRCRKCGVTTTYRAFYKHAKKHFNIKPFKCGYCSYRSIEKSKVRVHNTFCHPSHPPVILKLSPESAGIDCKTSSVCEVNIKEKNRNRGMLGMFDSGEHKTQYKEDFRDISHSSNISSLNAKPTVVSSSKHAVFQCLICSKILQKHTPSVRRHLYSHYGYKPYKCGYCSYTGIGQSEIRAHHVIHGLSAPPKIEDSGVPMPPDLVSHINNTFPFHRGTQPNQKEKELVGLRELVHDQTETGQGANIWKESSDTVKDITAVHFSSQNDTEENIIFSNDQKSLKAFGAATCSLPQVVECNTLVPEPAYAVQVVENLENVTSSNALPSQLNSGSVCVVYLIE